MSRPQHRHTARACVLALGAAVTASAAHAQTGNGFLLGVPEATVSIRVGYDHANANSDLFNDKSTIGALTLRKRDFSGPSAAMDLGIRASDRLDVVLGAAYTGSRARSEYRDFIDNNDQPIEQTTSFVRVPLNIGVRSYLMPRGRAIGRYAWIPNKVSPYVGGGGGFMWYRFKQQGDFIDFASTNQRVFTATLESSNWTASAHALAGVEYTVNATTALTMESRYTWAKAPMSSDFSGYQRIDLSGLGLTAGVAFRF